MNGLTMFTPDVLPKAIKTVLQKLNPVGFFGLQVFSGFYRLYSMGFKASTVFQLVNSYVCSSRQ